MFVFDTRRRGRVYFAGAATEAAGRRDAEKAEKQVVTQRESLAAAKKLWRAKGDVAVWRRRGALQARALRAAREPQDGQDQRPERADHSAATCIHRKALACAAAAAARQQPPPEMCGAPSGDGGGGGGGGGSAAGAEPEGWRREEPWEVLLSALYVPDAPPAAAQPLLLTGPAE